MRVESQTLHPFSVNKKVHDVPGGGLPQPLSVRSMDANITPMPPTLGWLRTPQGEVAALLGGRDAVVIELVPFSSWGFFAKSRYYRVLTPTVG
jgi:hypothetical protein